MIAIIYDGTDYLAGIPSDNPNDRLRNQRLHRRGCALRSKRSEFLPVYVRIVVMSHTFCPVHRCERQFQNGAVQILETGTSHYLLKEIVYPFPAAYPLSTTFTERSMKTTTAIICPDNIHFKRCREGNS